MRDRDHFEKLVYPHESTYAELKPLIQQLRQEGHVFGLYEIRKGSARYEVWRLLTDRERAAGEVCVWEQAPRLADCPYAWDGRDALKGLGAIAQDPERVPYNMRQDNWDQKANEQQARLRLWLSRRRRRKRDQPA